MTNCTNLMKNESVKAKQHLPVSRHRHAIAVTSAKGKHEHYDDDDPTPPQGIENDARRKTKYSV